uniref:Uncharacterized protein n=1 Tax=Echinococcus granulosus TaxID=6210 RepID=U6FQR9_ECHGR|nr:hypothetical protein EgrG_000408100 [Echinococcus granulosus]
MQIRRYLAATPLIPLGCPGGSAVSSSMWLDSGEGDRYWPSRVFIPGRRAIVLKATKGILMSM